jgi:putative PIN family toxin of toxin-antitoxin system
MTGNPLRVVLDTNVLLSLYVFSDSRFAPLRRHIESGAWQAISSAPCLDEFRRVLNYPQFGLGEEAQEQAYATYAAYATRIDLAAAPATLLVLPRCQDKDDQKFLEAARDGAAEWLVTADKALLKLARRDRLCGLFRILTPEAALAAA